MALKSVPDTMPDGARVDADGKSARSRWPVVFLLLAAVGWVWPHDPVAIPDRILDAAWILGWSTVIVLLGAASGYVLKSRWSLVAVPLALYAGGVLHWFQYEWGFREPHWPDFIAVSLGAIAVLTIVAGIPAGIACRVITADSRPFGRHAGGVRISAAIAGLLALISVTAFVVLPLPYLGGLFGFAALLAGIGVMQEGHPTALERILAVAGIALGGTIVIVQLYDLWNLLNGLL